MAKHGLAALAALAACAACASGDAGAVRGAWPPFPPSPVLVGAAAPAPARPSLMTAPVVTGEENFTCADGARLRLVVSADGARATARWDEGAPIALERLEEGGLTAYANAEAVLRRSGPRAAWSATPTVAVQPGDSLSKLALRYYGSFERTLDIAAANADAVIDPDRIYVGQVLRLPASERVCRRAEGAA